MATIKLCLLFLVGVGAAAGALALSRTHPAHEVSAAAARVSAPECCSDVTRLSLLLGPAKKETPAAAVELKTIKLAALLKEIESHKDKVVLVDLWANY